MASKNKRFEDDGCPVFEFGSITKIEHYKNQLIRLLDKVDTLNI